MKFADFLRESHLSPSIDDNDVLTVLDNNGIGYTRLKNDSNKLLYIFDNRYSLSYDGSLFTLYRHGNRIHYMNARNETEINTAIDTWNNSYKLASIEVSDDDIEQYIADLKSGDVKHPEFNAVEGGDEDDTEDNTDKDDTEDEDDSDDENAVEDDEDIDDDEQDDKK